MIITIPITITKGGGAATPVALVPVNAGDNLYLVGVRYSDDSTKLVSNSQLNETYECDDDLMMYFNGLEDCSDTELTLARDHSVPSGFEIVPYRAYIDSCNLNNNIISGNLIMEIDGAIFKCEGWSRTSGENFDESMENFELQTS